MDISRGGASVEVESVPVKARPLWLCLEAGGRVWGCEFLLIQNLPGRIRAHRVRGRFLGMCPAGFFQTAIYGARREPSATSTKGPSLWQRLKGGRGGQSASSPASQKEREHLRELVRAAALQKLGEGEDDVDLDELVVSWPPVADAAANGRTAHSVPSSGSRSSLGTLPC
jgi:hypothetical protein